MYTNKIAARPTTDVCRSTKIRGNASDTIDPSASTSPTPTATRALRSLIPRQDDDSELTPGRGGARRLVGDVGDRGAAQPGTPGGLGAPHRRGDRADRRVVPGRNPAWA